jgi:type III secretion system YscQ/HrcQ family protein
MALGLEVPLAHAVVDRLLGDDRPFAESRLQLTPVEWGIWTYLIVQTLDRAWKLATDGGGDDTRALRLRRLDLSLDRVGPDPFDPTDLGAIVTVRWPVGIGTTRGAARLWLPETLLDIVFDSSDRAMRNQPCLTAVTAEFASLWRAEAGFVTLSQGLKRLRIGGVLPLDNSRLTGTPSSPRGPIELACDLTTSGLRFKFPSEAVADSGGRMIRLAGALASQVQPREPLTLGINQPMTANPADQVDHGSTAAASAGASPLDVPVTLTVELGRVSLTLSRLADLKAGDVIELGRHSREPVELTSNGRLVARGELVLIDTELGVRVTHVFL